MAHIYSHPPPGLLFPGGFQDARRNMSYVDGRIEPDIKPGILDLLAEPEVLPPFGGVGWIRAEGTDIPPGVSQLLEDPPLEEAPGIPGPPNLLEPRELDF